MKPLQANLFSEVAKLGRGGMSTLARHLGVSPQAVRAWVSDGVEPGDDHVRKIAAYFSVTPQWLRYGSNDIPVPVPPPPPVLEYLLDDEQLLIQNYRRSTDEGKSHILTSSKVADKLPVETVLRTARTASNH